MPGKAKRQALRKLNIMDLKDNDQSVPSVATLTPSSSNDVKYNDMADTNSRLLQSRPEIIRFSCALRDRLSWDDPMIAAWDDLIDTLQKGSETPTPTRAGAATTRVSNTEKHGNKRSPSAAPSRMEDANERPIQRFWDTGLTINEAFGSGDEDVKTGVKRSYCETVVSEAYSPGPYTEEFRRDGQDGSETRAVEADAPTSDDKCTCGKLASCDRCWYSEANAGKCTCDDWDAICDYCRHADVDAWGCKQPMWSLESAPEHSVVPSQASGGFEALSSHSDIDEPRRATSVPAADPPPSPKYSVTYWAELEYGEQFLRVPIASGDVSGPEKWVIEGIQGMQKVWDWVVDMDLTDKVGLQDAFDLAMDMHGDPPVGFFSDSQGDRYGNVPVKSEVRPAKSEVRSRRGPLSAKKARLSPSPSDSDCLSVASDVLSR